MQFEKFDKIPRYHRGIIITEKLDGSNGQIYIADQPWDWVRETVGGELSVDHYVEPIVRKKIYNSDRTYAIWAGSRNRWCFPGKKTDNHGFARWVEEHAEELICGLGPGRHYGEWYGAGIGRNYGLDHKRFALFNTTRWNKSMWTEHLYNPWQQQAEDLEFRGKKHPKPMPTFLSPPECCEVVPVLYSGMWEEGTVSAVSIYFHRLRYHGSFAVPGFMNPEGIVIFHTASNHLYKATFDMDGGKHEANT